MWVREIFAANDVVAPHVMPFEVANALRSMALRARQPFAEFEPLHNDLLDLTVEYVPYHPLLAARAWELAPALSIYDATYVALAELLDAPLITLDQRLARAPGIRCEVLAYEG